MRTCLAILLLAVEEAEEEAEEDEAEEAAEEVVEAPLIKARAIRTLMDMKEITLAMNH